MLFRVVKFFLAAGFPDEKYKVTIATVVGNNQNGEKLIRLKSDLFPGNSLGPGYSGGPIVNRKGTSRWDLCSRKQIFWLCCSFKHTQSIAYTG